LPFSGETEIHGTEILLKEEILDAKIAKFLSVRRPNKNHYCSSHFYTGENERNLFQPNFLMIPLEQRRTYFGTKQISLFLKCKHQNAEKMRKNNFFG
jgi:hypothetical protein